MNSKLIRSVMIAITIIMMLNIFFYPIYGKGEEISGATMAGGDVLQDAKVRTEQKQKEGESSTVDSVISGADDFLSQGKDATYQIGKGKGAQNVNALNEATLKSTSDYFFNLLLSVAMVVAVIVGIILGIQFMTASIEEKAKIKETLLPYVISCIVAFGAFGIWKLAVTVLSEW